VNRIYNSIHALLCIYDIGLFKFYLHLVFHMECQY